MRPRRRERGQDGVVCREVACGDASLGSYSSRPARTRGSLCTMHEEMLRAALDSSGASDVEVGLIPFAREGACLVHLGRRGASRGT